MRTGDIVRMLGVTRGTINNWLNREDFKEFFSPGALGKLSSHRTFTSSDVLVLSTINYLRSHTGGQRIDDWQEIVDYLRTGERHEDFSTIPEDAKVSEREARQAVKTAATMTERDMLQERLNATQEEIKRLQNKLDTMQITINTMQTSHHKEVVELMREIAKLNREIGALQSKE